MTSNRSDSEREHRVVLEVRRRSASVRTCPRRTWLRDRCRRTGPRRTSRSVRASPRPNAEPRGCPRAARGGGSSSRTPRRRTSPGPGKGSRPARKRGPWRGTRRPWPATRRCTPHPDRHPRRTCRADPSPRRSRVSRVAPAASSRARNASRSSCFQFSTGCRSRTSTLASYACRNRATTDSYVSPIRSVLPAPGTGLPRRNLR